MENRIPIDTSVLCDMFDYISGMLVFAIQYRRRQGPHQITLPRSWLLELAATYREDIKMQLNLQMVFFRCMETVVRDIMQLGVVGSEEGTGAADLKLLTAHLIPLSVPSYLVFGRRPLAMLPMAIKNNFAARM